MFFLDAPDERVDDFKRAWGDLGDSIVVVGGDGLWNCHVHTDDIGGAIEAGIAVARPRDIRVTDLLEQVEEERWVRDAAALPPEPEPPAEPVSTAVVAIGTGDGIKRIFRSLGVAPASPGLKSRATQTKPARSRLDTAYSPSGLRWGSRRLQPPVR